ncbi:TonB-dependent receptor, partial [mine drainage metagenome]
MLQIQPSREAWPRRIGLRGPPAALTILVLASSACAAAPRPQPQRRRHGERLHTIIVTAQDRRQPLAEVPESITVFSARTLAALDIHSFNGYATKTPNLSFAYGAGSTGISNARTIAIRGITGQNLFGTSGATGFYIDNTPLPESINPRIVDVKRIEILKGPEGTLFGESSLGGTVRIITRKPDLTRNALAYKAQAGFTSGGGSADGGLDVIDNLALAPGRLATRIVLFGNHQAGYLTRTFPPPT